MALGATPESVLALVMKEGAATLAAGAIAGVGAALLLTRYLTSLLYGVTATDPATYIAVVAWIGARRVGRQLSAGPSRVEAGSRGGAPPRMTMVK
jgi:predicted exporter